MMEDYLHSKFGSFIIDSNGGYERSAHVHRCKSYVADLKNNWAYKDKTNKPKLKLSSDVCYNSDYKEIISKYNLKFVINNYNLK
jgi:hypothetical protein